jgi:CheY-like chemotaxis protein
MHRILLVHADRDTQTAFTRALRDAGHTVLTAASPAAALAILSSRAAVDLIVETLLVPDRAAFVVLRTIRGWGMRTPFIVLAGSGKAKDAVVAMRLGATDFIDDAIGPEELLALIDQTMSASNDDAVPSGEPGRIEAHAAARLSRALVRLADCPRDPRTIALWGQWIAASSGAVRSWCATAGFAPRRALVFGRILRAVLLNEDGRHRPENLLDIADLRTLRRMLRLGGFQSREGFPVSVDDFLERQTLTHDPDVLLEIRRAVQERQANGARANGIKANGATADPPARSLVAPADATLPDLVE